MLLLPPIPEEQEAAQNSSSCNRTNSVEYSRKIEETLIEGEDAGSSRHMNQKERFLVKLCRLIYGAKQRNMESEVSFLRHG